MRRLTLVSAWVILALALGAAAPAAAHHAATVSVSATSLTLDPSSCKQSERREVSRCDGIRRARVQWSGTCGATPSVSVDFYAAHRAGGPPIPLHADVELEGSASGSGTALLEPGARVYATATMDCYWEDPDGTGPDPHSVVVTSAPTAQVVVPPWLRGVETLKVNYCNFNPRSERLPLQAGQRGNILDLSVDYMDRSLLGTSRRKRAGIRQVWLRGRGAGVRLRQRPEMSLIQEFGRREPVSGALRVSPRRAGWLKLWAEVAGERTNSLAIRVVPNRC